MLLLLRNNKPCSDSLPEYFGSLDDYRYQLYTDLKDLKKLNKFPALYNNHLDLGRSSLLEKKSYGKPDTLVYVDRLKAEFKGKEGFIYFYKYKTKKDDLSWKLATVGLVPEDPSKFEFEDNGGPDDSRLDFPYFKSSRHSRYDFTSFGDTRIKEDEPLPDQLKKALKKMLYSRRKSAKEFYQDERNRSGNDIIID
jgi:hypothetical protein